MSILSSYGNEILVSYARGGESEHMVDELEQAFVSHGIHIVRDIKELGYKGSLEAFKRRIGRGQCIILVISDGYLRSENCMYELVEVHKNKHLRERIFPIVLAEAQIYKPIGRLNYIKHWDKQIEELNHAIKDVEIVSNLSGITADLDKYTIIRASFDHLTDLLSDMYTLTSESHQANGFSTLIDAVKNAMGMTSSVSLPDISDGSGAPPNVEQPLKTYYSDLMENKEFLAEFERKLSQSPSNVVILLIAQGKIEELGKTITQITDEMQKLGEEAPYPLSDLARISELEVIIYGLTESASGIVATGGNPAQQLNQITQNLPLFRSLIEQLSVSLKNNG